MSSEAVNPPPRRAVALCPAALSWAAVNSRLLNSAGVNPTPRRSVVAYPAAVSSLRGKL